MTRVFGIVGSSGSGKTVLLEKLIARLTTTGVRVNAIKHSHHDVQIDPPGKDSRRLREAGASEVMLVSGRRYAIVRELIDEPEPDILTQLARLSPADITLIEGARRHPFPKLEVWRAATGQAPRYPGEASIIALASDDPAPVPHTLASFGLEDIAAVAQFVLEYAVSPPTAG
ncbi:MAG: molybdopterin-guanine dinucleotide biosynthesis protein B [Rhodocyclaceae bacterium]